MPEEATIETPTQDAPSGAMEALDALFPSESAPENQPAAQEPAKPAPASPSTPPPATDTGSTDLDDIPKRQTKPAKATEPAPPAGTIPKPSTPAPTAEDPKTLKQFREQYETTKKERDDYAKKLADFEKAQAEGTRKEVEKARAELAAEIDKHRKRADELETRVKFLDYSKSDEFGEKYQKPLVKAWHSAIEDVKGTTITADDGTTREATANDILQLTQLDTGAARVRARELFGEAAPEMMAHRKNILELGKSRDTALEEWRTKGSEREAEAARTTEQNRSKTVQMWEGTIKEFQESNPELFGDDPADSEGNDLLKKGDAIVRLAFTGEGLKEGMTSEQRTAAVTRAQASVAARARAFGRQVLRANKLRDEVDTLKEKLKAFEKSEPGAGSQKSDDGAAGKAYRRPEDAIDDL